MATIRNPIEWSLDQLKSTAHYTQSVRQALQGAEDRAQRPTVRKISLTDLQDVLAKGFEDFMANRTDVLFLCIVYPIAGIVLSRFLFNADLLPLLFPLASGFALLGPIAAIGLYEMSRRREQGLEANWTDVFATLASPSVGAILVLGLLLLLIFAIWLSVAHLIYSVTLGATPSASFGDFATAVLTTGAGWKMIVLGTGVGFLFAAAVLMISVVSFPLLLDRNVGLVVAVGTSLRAVWANPKAMAAWGLIVAGGLVLGSIPVFLGLILVMPILGHATWHLYRKVVV